MLDPQILPSFFIIGPPRTGTSWLHQVLSKRTALPSTTKETRFFDRHFYRGIDWYRSHYSSLHDGMKVGEVAPTYFASTDARSRIWLLNPKAKIVCTFRNPVDRVLSLYRLKRAYGMFSWSLDDALVRDPELAASSKYATHLRAWQSEMGTERVLPTVYDDLRENPQAYLDVLTDFIGVPRFSVTSTELTYSAEVMTLPKSYQRTRIATEVAHWLKAQNLNKVVTKVKDSWVSKLFLGGGSNFPQVPASVLQRLHDQFRPEVEELETLLSRDLSHWKFPARTASSESVRITASHLCTGIQGSPLP